MRKSAKFSMAFSCTIRDLYSQFTYSISLITFTESSRLKELVERKDFMLQINTPFFPFAKKENSFSCRFLRNISMIAHKQLLKLTTNMSNVELDRVLFQRVSWKHRHRMVFVPLARLAFPFHLVSKEWNWLDFSIHYSFPDSSSFQPEWHERINY